MQRFDSILQWAHPRTLGKFIRFVYQSFEHHHGVENAKSLTYTSLFAVVPLLTLTVAVLSAFPAFQDVGARLQAIVFARLIPGSIGELQNYITSFTTQARNLTWVGAAMLLVTSYLMLVNVERSFNTIWGVGGVRKGLYSFLLYWSVLSLGPLLLGIGFAVSSYITSLSLFTTFTEVSEFVGVNSLLLVLFPLLLSALGFTLLYAAVPNCGVRIVHALAGGIIVAVAFVLVRNVFTWFIAQASFEFVYGAFAAIPIFLIWIYVCWVVILLGANLVRSIPLFQAQQQSVQEDVHPSLLMLALLHRFWLHQQQGDALVVEDLGQERWPFRGIELEEFLELLGRHKVVHPGAQGEYLLSRDLHALPLWQLLAWLPWPLPGPEELDKPLPEVLERHLPSLPLLRRKFAALQESRCREFGESVDELFRKTEA